jgi:uncharacterized protein YndB with AHSA1/START domain
MMAEDGQALEVTARVDAPPETVFSYFTDPEKYRRWMGREAELDPRPGGLYRVKVSDLGAVSGRYVEVDPPRRVIFTWGWEGNDEVPPGSSTVEVTLEADGDATIVRLRHTGLPGDESRALHGQGWTHYLSRLSVAGAGGEAGPDPLDRS